MTRDEIASIPLFAGLGERSLDLLADTAAETSCGTGQALALPGDPGSGMFVLLEGAVTVELPERRIELGPGEFFGELALFVPESGRIARVRAATDVRCLAVPRDVFLELIDTEPRLARRMLEGLSRRLIDAQQHA